MIGIAERRDADRLALEVLEAANFPGLLWRDDEGKERQPAGDGKASHRRAMGIGLKGDIERRRCIIDCAADQRLHRRLPAAHRDELDRKPLFGEVAVGFGDDIGNDAQQLAAKGELHRLAGRACRHGAQHSGERRRSF